MMLKISQVNLRRMAIATPLIPLIIIPWFVSEYVVYAITIAVFYAILATSYDLLLGYTGQLSFCQGAFYGIGAYISALLTMRTGMPFWLALFLVGILTFAICAGVGFPALRLRGAYFAVTTFFFAHFIYLIFLNEVDLTGGPLGLKGIRPPESIHLPYLGVIDFRDITTYYYLVLVFFLLTTFFLYKLVNSNLGRIFIAIREDEMLAQSIGINTPLYKVLSFSISGMIAGMAGSLFAHFFRLLHPASFTWLLSEMVVIITLVGGAGTLFGPIIGAAIVIFILEFMRFAPELRFIVWSAALIAVLIFEPRGLIGVIKRLGVRV